MTPNKICQRIDRDLRYLAVEFIQNDFTGAALRLLEMAQGLRGESFYGDDAPQEIADLLSAEGGAV